MVDGVRSIFGMDQAHFRRLLKAECWLLLRWGCSLSVREFTYYFGWRLCLTARLDGVRLGSVILLRQEDAGEPAKWLEAMRERIRELEAFILGGPNASKLEL